jgi:hypothetical protein
MCVCVGGVGGPRVLSLERRNDRSGASVVRLYQNWRQGVSSTPPPLRSLRPGEGP